MRWRRWRRPEELARALRLTPYSREEFAQCCATWKSIEDELERACRWYVRCRQAFGGSAATVGWGYEVSGVARGGTRSGSFATTVDHLERFAERFRRVEVDRLGWRTCLERYDGPSGVFYLDPPYHPQTRAPGGRLERHSTYVHELSAEDHEALVAAATHLSASVLISGYPHPSYDEPLAATGFERFVFEHNSTASRDPAGRGSRTEVVWRRLEQGQHPQLWRATGAVA